MNAYYPPTSIYHRNHTIPSETIPVNPRYATLLSSESSTDSKETNEDDHLEEEEEEQQRIQKRVKEEVLFLFKQWNDSFHSIEKCKMAMQKHKQQLHLVETQLKSLLATKKPEVVVPFQGSLFRRNAGETIPSTLSIESLERKQAFTAKYLQGLLIQKLGEHEGKELFHYLQTNRGVTKTVETLKIRKVGAKPGRGRPRKNP